MPGGDGTGPMGQGSMTGRAAGFCAGYGMPGYANPVAGRGRGGWGRGGGWGRRNWFYATGLTGWQRAAMGWPGADPYGAAAPTSDQELDMLKAQAEQLSQALTNIQKRVQEIEASAAKE